LLDGAAVLAAAATPTPPATTIATVAARTRTRFVKFLITVVPSRSDHVDRATSLFGARRTMDVNTRKYLCVSWIVP
jgi:hypothetical protein